MNGRPSTLCALVLSFVHMCTHTISCYLPRQLPLWRHSGSLLVFLFLSGPLWHLYWRLFLFQSLSPFTAWCGIPGTGWLSPALPFLSNQYSCQNSDESERPSGFVFPSGFLLSSCQFTEHRMFSIMRNYQTSTLALAHSTSNEGTALYQPSKCGYWASEVDHGDWGVEFWWT